MPVIGPLRKSGSRMPMNKRKIRGPNMKLLTPIEKEFLDVFLHEATNSPFTGPATRALHAIGVEYGDITYLAWAYNQEVLRTCFDWGHSDEVAPPVPWPNRETTIRRDQELQRLWKERREPADSANV
jgi:hypothetical protein